MWATVVLLTAAAANGAETDLTYDLRKGVENTPALRLYGTHVQQMAGPDARGLRFILPARRSPLGAVGLDAQFAVRGDFDIELRYEIVRLGTPRGSQGAGVQLWFRLETRDREGASVGRLQTAWGPVFETALQAPGAGKESYVSPHTTPAKANAGRLRLVRTGKSLRYLAADGNADFHELRAEEIGTEDVRQLKAVCTSGDAPVDVDMRLIEWRIRATSLPNASPLARPAKTRYFWWVAGGLAVAVAAGGVGLFLYRRRKRAAA